VDFAKLCSTQLGMKLTSGNGVRILTGRSETGGVSCSPHPVVSQWVMDAQELHETQIHYRMTELVTDVFGLGFGDRGRASQLGSNIYFGTRSSDQSSPTPAEGPGQASLSQYYRQNYAFPLIRASIEKLSKVLGAKVKTFSGRINYLMDRFLPKDKPCALWTQGVHGKVFGFLNDRHVDETDRLDPEYETELLAYARATCAGSRFQYTHDVMAYLVETSELVGLGHSTTCAYQHVFHPKAPKEMIQVLQFFVMPGLGCCVPILHNVGHDFLAYAFSHYTSCCVVVQDGLVSWRSNGCVNVVAWGNWENARRERNRVRREAPVPPPGPNSDAEDQSESGSGVEESQDSDEPDDDGDGGDELEMEQAEPRSNLYTVTTFEDLDQGAIEILRNRAMSRNSFGHLMGIYRRLVIETEVENEDHGRTKPCRGAYKVSTPFNIESHTRDGPPQLI
jgi:hypothetical protein